MISGGTEINKTQNAIASALAQSFYSLEQFSTKTTTTTTTTSTTTTTTTTEAGLITLNAAGKYYIKNFIISVQYIYIYIYMLMETT